MGYLLVCDYEEFEPATYNGVCILEFDKNKEGKEVLRANTGNFVEDYNEIIKQFDQGFTVSSTVDNYISDFNKKNYNKIQFVFPNFRESTNVISGVKLVKEDYFSKCIRLTKEADERIICSSRK